MLTLGQATASATYPATHPAATHLASVISPDHLLNSFGLAGLIIIIFAECGLLIGFFLPGDTLLFAAGLLLSTGKIHPLWAFLVCVPLAAIAGNLVGYAIGYRVGPKVFDRPESRIFKPEYVERSAAFFERFGTATILLARFVPIVRTVATVMAGVSRMRFAIYALYSVIGGAVWTVGVLLIGYWLGHIDVVRNHIEPLIDPILLAVVVISLIPIGIHYFRGRRNGEPSAPTGGRHSS
jgi:membrane-associated protein